MTGQGDLAGRLVETAAEAMADYIGDPARTPIGELTYRPYVEAVLAAVLPPLADHVEACADSSTPLRGYGIRDAAALLRDLAVRVAR